MITLKVTEKDLVLIQMALMAKKRRCKERLQNWNNRRIKGTIYNPKGVKKLNRKDEKMIERVDFLHAKFKEIEDKISIEKLNDTRRSA